MQENDPHILHSLRWQLIHFILLYSDCLYSKISKFWSHLALESIYSNKNIIKKQQIVGNIQSVKFNF